MAERLILDSGAVIALAAGDADAHAFLRFAETNRMAIIVPAVVIVETTRGAATDAPVNRVLKRARNIAPIDEVTARLAGRLLRRLGNRYSTHSPPTIDALVAAVAIARGGGVILTGDHADLVALVADHPEVQIRHWRT